ncbi:MAG TPA: mycofactocin biosynthesis peptidyl-dipeptidase MftE [Acidimicrobiales bacterium]
MTATVLVPVTGDDRRLGGEDRGLGGDDRRLGWLTSPDVAALASGPVAPVLAVPVGSTEQHGPHLPLSTDTDIAVALCERLSAATPAVVVAPCLSYGASGEHEGFAGTVSIGQDALELVLVELGRSATASFAGVVLVNTHGGNAAAARRAEQRLAVESRQVLLWMPDWGGDAHAGRTETSLQLALDDAAVRADRAEAGETRPVAELLPALRQHGVAAVSPNGVLGDPAGASAVEGAALLDRVAAELVGQVTTWRAEWPAGWPR